MVCFLCKTLTSTLNQLLTIYYCCPPGEEACKKILVHGYEKYSDHMGIYRLKSDKINGYVAYVSPFPENKFMIRNEGVSWILEDVVQSESIGISFFLSTQSATNKLGDINKNLATQTQWQTSTDSATDKYKPGDSSFLVEMSVTELVYLCHRLGTCLSPSWYMFVTE